MSITQFFQASVAQSGFDLRLPGANRGPGLVGRALFGSAEYNAVQAMRMRRDGVISGLLGGKSIAGQRLDGFIKADSRHADRLAYAEFLARSAEWAEYLAQKFPGGGKMDSAEGHFAGGLGVVKQYMTECHGDKGARLDATVPMASQGLTYIFPEVYRFQHNSLPCWDEEFLKINRSVSPAANDYAWYETDNVGVAKASSSYDVTGIPMVNGPIASDNKGLIVPFLVGFETNFMDPRREALAVSMGKPDFQIEVMKRQACDRALAEAADNLWFGGDATLGIDGLMNHPVVETITISGAWSGKTALQILDDLKTMVWAIANRTAGQLGDLGRVRIILPPDQYQLLLAPITAAGSASIMEYFIEFFKQAGHGVPKVEMQYRLAASNSYAYNGGPNILTEDTAIILYETGNPMEDPTFVLSQPIEVPAPVRQTGVGDVTYYHMRCGGMMLPDARRIKYVVGL